MQKLLPIFETGRESSYRSAGRFQSELGLSSDVQTGGGAGRWATRLFLNAPDEPEHKTHWDFQSLAALLERTGFRPVLLEYFDAAGRFHRNAWKRADGDVRRSYGSAYNKQFRVWAGFDSLSLIIDGIKE